MTVKANAYIIVDGRPCCVSPEPFELSARHGDEIQSIATERVRSLLNDGGVFVPSTYYFAAMPPRSKARPTTGTMHEGVECECDVYCLKAADPSNFGLKLGQLVTELKTSFHLSDMTEDMLTPWHNPPNLESQWSSFDEDKRFEDCDTIAGVCMYMQ